MASVRPYLRNISSQTKNKTLLLRNALLFFSLIVDIPKLEMNAVICNVTKASKKKSGQYNCGIGRIDWQKKKLFNETIVNILVRLYSQNRLESFH